MLLMLGTDLKFCEFEKEGTEGGTTIGIYMNCLQDNNNDINLIKEKIISQIKILCNGNNNFCLIGYTSEFKEEDFEFLNFEKKKINEKKYLINPNTFDRIYIRLLNEKA